MRRVLLSMLLVVAVDDLRAASTVTGRVTWNDQGADAVRVRLCRIAESISEKAEWEGCSDEAFTKTNSRGSYTFEKVATGSYVVMVEQSGGWWYVRRFEGGKKRSKVRIGGEVIETIRYRVNQNAAVTADTIKLVKDLVLEHPIGATVNSAQPTLTWKKVPEANHYKVSMDMLQRSPYGPMWSGTVFFERTTKETRLKISERLRNCLYGWGVSAHNANGTEIARSERWTEFTVTGQRNCF